MTRRRQCRRTSYEFLATVFATLLAAGPLAGCRPKPQTIVVAEMRIPTNESGVEGLEAIMVRPNDNAPHPLALLTHGTAPPEIEMRSQMTPLRFVPQAREFARRGWTAVIVARRGFGDSGGIYAEDSSQCTDFIGPTQEAVKDLREAAAYLATRPEVDASRMIGVGLSTGGMAMVGLSADPPAGLKAAINFAGGRGSDGKDHVCNADSLIRAFGDFGQRSKTPMLWVYAANDHFFGPQLAQQLYGAFADNGGKATFITPGPFGTDGHDLFSQEGAPIWTPIVDDFLRSHDLVLRDTLLPDPPPDVSAPSHLGQDGRSQFAAYLLRAPHKAFATSRSGAFGFSFGRRTAADAEARALLNCTKFTREEVPCTIAATDDQKAPN